MSVTNSQNGCERHFYCFDKRASNPKPAKGERKREKERKSDDFDFAGVEFFFWHRQEESKKKKRFMKERKKEKTAFALVGG